MNFPILICLAALSPVLLAATPEQQVVTAEKSWSSGIVAADLSRLDKCLSSDLVYNHSTGQTDTKKSYIGRIGGGTLKYVSFAYDADPKVRIYGDTAVVFASARVSSVTDGKTSSPHLQFLHVFVKQDGRWQLVAHQSVVLPK